MTLENEKRLLLLMSSYIIKINVTKRKVLDFIDDKEWIVFSANDLAKKHNRNELVWRNDFAFIRKHWAQEGLYNSGIRDDWSITEKGIEELKRLCSEALEASDLQKVSSKALNDASKILRGL